MAVQNFDVVGAARAGEQYRVMRDKQLQQQQDEKLLRDLSPKIQAGDPSAYGQAATVNPEGANAALGAGDTMARRAEGLIKMLEQADTSNPQAAQALWQQYGVPFARQFSQGTEPTANWAEAKPMVQQLKARIEMAKNAGAAGSVQSTYVDGDGNRVAVMRDGSKQILGPSDLGATNQTIKVTGPDGREGVYTFDRRTGGYVPAALGGAQMAPSGARIDASVPEATRQLIMQDEAGFNAVPDNGVVRGAPQFVDRSGSPFVSRSPEEQAALTTAAQEEAKLRYLPENERIKTEAAIAQAGGSEEAKQRSQARVELEQLLPKVQSDSRNAIALIDKALNHPGRAASTGLSSVNPLNRLPGSDAMNFRVLLDQLRGGTFLQAFQSLKGGGAITQVEGQKAEQAIARLNEAQSDDEFIVALEDLRKVAEGLPSSIQKKLIAATQGSQAQPAPSRGPSPGTVEDGYRFKGGNPADPSNWERL